MFELEAYNTLFLSHMCQVHKFSSINEQPTPHRKSIYTEITILPFAFCSVLMRLVVSSCSLSPLSSTSLSIPSSETLVLFSISTQSLSMSPIVSHAIVDKKYMCVGTQFTKYMCVGMRYLRECTCMQLNSLRLFLYIYYIVGKFSKH